MWSELWGSMVWGGTTVTPVPLFSPVGLAILGLMVATTAVIMRRARYPRWVPWGSAVVAVAIPLAAVAGVLAVPNTFSNGTIADAGEVNANFAAVETEVNDNDARIAALEAGSNSVLYTRWGRSDCPTGASLVYAGVMGGALETHTGSGSNSLCLTTSPTFSDFNDANHNGALIYGAEYETVGYGIGSLTPLQNMDVPCAVCLRDGPAIVLQHPGTMVCPTGFDLEYPGYLMATHFTQVKSDFLCVDQNAVGIGSAANQDGRLLYPTEAECGSLPCGPGQYVQDRELTCSVCTR